MLYVTQSISGRGWEGFPVEENGGIALDQEN